MKIYTSYFYQIRNFKPYMIPVSTALSDPIWYRPPQGKEYWIDKRGVMNGLRYTPLMVQAFCEHICPCEHKGAAHLFPQCCKWLQEYGDLLNNLNKNEILKAFEHCGQFAKKKLGFQEEPVIVLIVHEAWNNPCSERCKLQEYFHCTELSYPIV